MTAQTEYEIFVEIHNERREAHLKHGANSMERQTVDSPRRLPILVEEVGEVAQVFNDAPRSLLGTYPPDLDDLRAELVQVAAMAIAWIAAIDGIPLECEHMSLSGEPLDGAVYWRCHECHQLLEEHRTEDGFVRYEILS